MYKNLTVLLFAILNLSVLAQSENATFFPVFSDIEISNFKKNNITSISKYEFSKDEKGIEQKQLNEQIVFNNNYQVIAWQSRNNFTKSMENYAYMYEQNKLTKRIKKIEDKIVEIIDLKYDENGRIKNYVTSDEKNRLYTNLYRYDEKGNISTFKVLRYTSYGMHLKIFEKKYNAENLLEQEDIYDVKGEEKSKLNKQFFYTYDNTLLIQKQEVNNNSGEDFIEKYRYNEQHLLAETAYYSDNKKQYSIHYAYDNQNRILTQENKDAESKIIFSIANEYNADGRLTKTVEQSKENTTITNTYDARQLLTMQSIDKSGNINQIKIEYQ